MPEPLHPTTRGDQAETPKTPTRSPTERRRRLHSRLPKAYIIGVDIGDPLSVCSGFNEA